MDRQLKYQNVSRLIVRSLSILFSEIRKCRLLCANCHMIQTYKEVKR
jgi:hypothetical protein